MAQKHPKIAKLSRPNLYDAAPRERLFDRLDEIRTHPLLWVSGPPGSGKTTLVASWLESRGLGGIWYQIDSGDLDVSTFIYYLGMAAQAMSKRKRPLPLLTPEYLPDLTGFARRYFRELFSRLPEAGTLVLDDCHDFPADAAFWDILLQAAAEIAPGKNMIVMGRGKPPPKLVRLIANQTMSGLEWEDLRLTRNEAAAIAATRPHRHSAVTELLDRSDGWVAGLILMLDRTSEDHASHRPTPMQPGQEVFDYFADQVFDQASDEARAVLLAVALLPACTGPQATALTGDATSGHVLESLYRRQLFVDRHDDVEPSYRLHDLFREFLIVKGKGYYARPRLDDLRLKAATLLESSGLVDSAFDLVAHTGNWAVCTRLVLENARKLQAEGRHRTLRAWIDRLPPAVRQEQPWLGYWSGLAEFQVNQKASRTTLSQTYDAFEARGDAIGMVSTASAILTGFYFEYADWKPADPWIDRLAALLQAQPALPAELDLFAQSAMLYGIAYRQTSHPMLARYVERTLSLLKEDIDVNMQLQAGMAITGPVACMLGAFSLFHEVRGKLTPLLADARVTELNRACWHMTSGVKLCFDCEFEEAYEELGKGARLAQQFNLRQIEFLSRFFTGVHAACYFDLGRASEEFARARALVDFDNPLQRTYFLWGQCVMGCATGDVGPALERASEAKSIGDSLGAAALSIIGSVYLASTLTLNGRYEEAESLARDAINHGTHHKVPTWEASLLFLLAWSHHERGDETGAREFLGLALARGKDGSSAYFRWLFSGARKMLRLALDTGIDASYAQSLIRRFRYAADGPRQENWPWSVKVWTLGGFRLEVDGEPPAFGRKVPRRTLELLQCLIALGGKDVPDYRLTDELWPDAEADEAHGRLMLALHRLRRLLGNNDAVRLQGGKFSLDLGLVWVDLFALEAALSDTSRHDASEQVSRLYQGEFLASEAVEPWMLPVRDRLRRLLDRPVASARSLAANP